ncbi:DUF7283 family protein [Halobacterium zhouii]|uniref:DUF7283 family protein n=1 Tax=Halobacterium zhouii TaxID=2902624 RepID=UPI001E485096|nr:hypothetical protein [Halobacterium zhouii]
MLDVPADVPPVLVALSLVSTTLFGVALAVRPSPVPRVQPLAATVDAVAAADHSGAETTQIGALAVKIGEHELAVRGPGGTAHASLSYGPVVPVRRDTALWRVLRGTPPDAVFDTPVGLATAAAAARGRDPVWRTNADRLTVRRVSWRGVDVTLVGA